MGIDRRKLRAAVIGKDGRTSALRKMLERSPRVVGDVPVLHSGKGPDCLPKAIAAAQQFQSDLVVVGPEEPLANGIVDALAKVGIPAVGPTQLFARLESSKSFTRELLAKHGIPGNPRFAVFTSLAGVEPFLSTLEGFVVKPDGLTGGKGVKVSGDHLNSISDALAYCAELLSANDAKVVIEERLDGEEFSLQSFCDGFCVKHTVPVQDHKRAFDGDKGPNTGGMGSYSCADHLLPFLDEKDVAEAERINGLVAEALKSEFAAETSDRYKGILFGGFIATRNGVKLLEYNARFGDPEALNVLSLLETDLLDVFEAIVNGRLADVPITFRRQATVCKYIVPTSYPEPMTGDLDLRDVPEESDRFKMYFAAVDPSGDDQHVVHMTGSRAVAMVGIGDTLEEANQAAERGARAVRGPARYRVDIGTTDLIERRKRHMASIREQVPSHLVRVS